jgi:hypothetical protein
MRLKARCGCPGDVAVAVAELGIRKKVQYFSVGEEAGQAAEPKAFRAPPLGVLQ